MRVTRVAAEAIRSLTGVTFEPGAGVNVVTGPNGAGKTNLVEAIYFGLTARSFRTSDRRDLIPFGTGWARCRIEVTEGEGAAAVTHRFMTAIDRAEGLRYTLDGAPVDRQEAVRHRPAITVFSPDRLELVKGPPAVRRRHLDGFVAARWPLRAGLRKRFGQVLAQRNALLARLREAGGDSSLLDPWDRQLSLAAVELAGSRSEAVAALAAPWVEAVAELGLEGETGLIYRPGGELEPDEFEAGLRRHRERDITSGRTGPGPHHDEVRLELEGRQLRRFGSQGQQRIGLLALLFAEREALLESGRPAPLMLLDDVMSELDGARRRRLIDRLLTGGQAVITAAEGELVPEDSRIERVRMAALTAADARTVETAGSPDA